MCSAAPASFSTPCHETTAAPRLMPVHVPHCGPCTKRQQGGPLHQRIQNLRRRSGGHPLCRLPRRHAEPYEAAATLFHAPVPLVLQKPHVRGATGAIQPPVRTIPQKEKPTPVASSLGGMAWQSERTFRKYFQNRHYHVRHHPIRHPSNPRILAGNIS